MGDIASKIDLVKSYLDVRIAAHSIYASNISNSETPHYIAKEPRFESKLDQAQNMWKLGMRVTDSPAAAREDGNNVQLEQEMASLAENSLSYMSAIQILNKEMAIARYAASEIR